jgi:hypothetical protein
MNSILNKIFKQFFKHKHEWQSRGTNRYGGTTYRVCIKCRESQIIVNNSWEDDRFEKCDSLPELDSQFDDNDNYIFAHQS